MPRRRWSPRPAGRLRAIAVLLSPALAPLRLLLPLLPLAIILGPGLAHAEPGTTEWRSGIEAETSVPLGFGVRLWGEGPLRLRLEVAADYLPSSYYDLQKSTRLVGPPATPPGAEQFVRQSLVDSWAGAFHVGWRPLPRAGLVLSFGYRFAATLGGALGGAPWNIYDLGFAAGVSPPGSEPGSQAYIVKTALHQLEGEVGYQWSVWHDRITLRATVGVSGVIASTVSVKPLSQSVDQPLVAEFVGKVGAAIQRSHAGLCMPYVGLAIGYEVLNAGRNRAPEALPAEWDRRPDSTGFDNR